MNVGAVNVPFWLPPGRLTNIRSHSARTIHSYQYTLLSGSGCFATDGQSASLSWYRTPMWSPWPDFFTVGYLRSSCCGAPSLTRGRVCTLLVQFTFTLRSKSRRTHDHILLSHLRLPQPGRPGSCIYIPQEQGGPVILPGAGFTLLLWPKDIYVLAQRILRDFLGLNELITEELKLYTQNNIRGLPDYVT
jgi:hypothetical protein